MEPLLTETETTPCRQTNTCDWTQTPRIETPGQTQPDREPHWTETKTTPYGQTNVCDWTETPTGQRPPLDGDRLWTETETPPPPVDRQHL